LFYLSKLICGRLEQALAFMEIVQLVKMGIADLVKAIDVQLLQEHINVQDDVSVRAR
jgi:hypothetical protein